MLIDVVEGCTKAYLHSLTNLCAPANTPNTAESLQFFEFVIKTAPAAVQILSAINKKSGSGEPNRVKIGAITWDQIRVIAEDKMEDLNAFTVESAMKMIAGTARSMGINVKGVFPSK